MYQHLCLLSPRESDKIMGLPDSYILPERYNDAYHLAGDGVAVPVVRFLAHHLLEPLLKSVKVRERLQHEKGIASRADLEDYAKAYKFQGKGPLSVALVVQSKQDQCLSAQS